MTISIEGTPSDCFKFDNAFEAWTKNEKQKDFAVKLILWNCKVILARYMSETVTIPQNKGN